MVLLKQSTSVVVSFGPFCDKTDGMTFETGLAGTGANQLEHTSSGILISKNGGSLAARHATATASVYDAYGMYKVTLDATDTGTLGVLRVCFGNNDALPVWQDFLVVTANVYDSLIAGSDILDVSMTQILGTAVSSPATAGILDVNVKNIDNDAASASGTVTFPNATLASTTNISAAAGCAVSSIGAGVITAAAIATGAVDADALASDAVTEIWNGSTCPTATQNADALLNRDMSAVSDTNARSPLNALRFLRNKWAIAGGVLTVKEEDDTTTAWTANLTTDPLSDPITTFDPS